MQNEASKLRQNKGLIKWIAAAGVFALLAPPLAQAATQKVKVVNTPKVKIKDSQGGNINARKLPKYGRFGAPGTSGAVDSWEMKGAFLGYIDNTDNTPNDDIGNTMTIPAAGGTAELHSVIIAETPNAAGTSPDCEVEISTDAVEAAPGVPLPLLEATVTELQTINLPLRLTDDLHIKITGENNATNTNCAAAIIGYAPQSAILNQ